MNPWPGRNSPPPAALAPGVPHREQPRTHPYTLQGRQVDIRQDGGRVEVWECGLAHPRVLAAGGLPGHSGLAVGMGLDRLLMLAKGIPDIRLLRSGDPRIACQLHDLASYQPVSPMPAITRCFPPPPAGAARAGDRPPRGDTGAEEPPCPGRLARSGPDAHKRYRQRPA
ncbi:MAG: hypothetical protein ABSA02_09755 [Trebonia sp.]